MSSKSLHYCLLTALAVSTFTLSLSSPALHADTILTQAFTTSSGAGGSGGQTTNCMVMSDGTTWSGGAAGVQGDTTTGVGNVTPLAANTLFKFNIGSYVDSLNSTYGTGSWSVTSITLTLQYTLYANNPRFGGGAGTFDTYWISNDTWSSNGTLPVYATNETTLGAWSNFSNLGEQYYGWSTPSYQGTTADVGTSIWSTDKTGNLQSTMTLTLEVTSALLADIYSASVEKNSDLSLYLMATSDTMGLTIFTGGGSTLPTVTMQVAATPEPSASALLLGSVFVLCLWSSRAKKRRLSLARA